MMVQPNSGEIAVDQSMSHLVHNMRQFLRVIRYRRGIMFMSIIIALLLAGLYAATATRYYQSEASLLIQQSGKDLLTSSATLTGMVQEIIPTYERLIKMPVVLNQAIQELPTPYRIDFRGVPRDKWVDTLAANLTTSAVRKTNIIDVRYRSKDPHIAAEVVNAVITSYLAFIERTHKGTADDILKILTKEKTSIEVTLNQKSAALIEARKGFGDFGIRSGGKVIHPLVQRAISLNTAIIAIREKRLQTQAALTGLKSAVRNGENLQQHVLAAEGAVGREFLLSSLGLNSRDSQMQAGLERQLLADQSELQSMGEFMGPAHPQRTRLENRIRLTQQFMAQRQGQVIQQVTQMQDTRLGPMLIEMTEQSLARIWQQESSLRSAFDAASHEAVELSGNLATIEILEHDVSRLRSLYDVLVEQIAATDLRQEHGDIRATVVKEATVSLNPVSPRIAFLFVMALVGASIAGSAIIYVQDILDDRFRSPEEMTSRLGVQTLSMIRQLEPNHLTGLAGVQAYSAPDTHESEAFRTLRTALAFSSQETGQIVISSSEPGDGKTTVLVNLAVSMAQSGKRTLLIDADLRRPGLTDLFQAKGSAGLSEILQSDENVGTLAEQYICGTEIDELNLLFSGTRRPNPSELLASPRLGELLAWAEPIYDQILIDSPPVLAASDVLMIGRLVDGAILVIQPEKNRRRLVTRAVESFSALGVPILGLVANRIASEDGRGYGYGYGYGYEYRYGEPGEDPEFSADVDLTSPLDNAESDDLALPQGRQTTAEMIVPRKVA